MEQLWGWWLKQCSLRLVLVAPRRMALGTPMGLLVAAVGPVTGMVTAWAEGDRGAGPCALPVPFALTPHNNFNQLLHIEVWGHCGTWGDVPMEQMDSGVFLWGERVEDTPRGT